MQDPLSQRVNIEERRTDANASALVSQAEAELLRWFSDSEESIDERLGKLSPEEVRHLLDHVRQIVQHQDAKFTCMLEISSALGTTFHIDDLLKIVVEKTTELMDAERSTLFLVDEETGELWSKIVQGTMNIEIRLKLGQGIAGWVAKTGKSLNIRDAYTDPRFNPKVDEESGYQTRNILCQPIRNLQGEIIGVIQVLNRVSGNFTDEDEYLLSAIASQAAIAIENSKLYLAAIAQNMELIEIKDKLEHKVAELDMLFELERQISRSKSGEDLFKGVFSKTLELVHAQAAALTLRGDRFHQLFTLIDRS
ncbi:MAG: GAF domain-containing protein, partial [Myxococcota bacterium]|nr:GAF domain-containing protein [Myxococcota bacterium]